MNKKGMAIEGIVLYGLATCMVIASALLTPSHRQRQAIQFCQEEGLSQDFCEQKVSTMKPDAILAYIRDDSPYGERIKEIKDY